MTDITWTNCRVKLGDLKPWAENPRMSSKKQAQNILYSWKKYGQVETIGISPTSDVYNGHQRLSALLTLYGEDYEVDARRASRHLIDEERKELTILLHAGATGSFDWGIISGWTAEETKWLDSDVLAGWNFDALNLREKLNSEVPPVDPEKEWEGMPEHISEEIRDNAITCIVRFLTEDARKEFEEFLGWKLSHKGKTYSTWFPKLTLDQLGKGLEFVDES